MTQASSRLRAVGGSGRTRRDRGRRVWSSSTRQTRAVDDISFRIARGSITGLLGGNGAGKTTTIAMIMGLVLPTSGRVEVLGHPMPRGERRRARADEFREPLCRHADAAHGAAEPHRLRPALCGRASARTASRKLAADLDLNDFLDRANGKLSAGQKTRVALAKALINQPELLLLDEPTASLDPDTADWVREHLETYRRTHNATILLASHNMLEVERLCDRVIILKRGRIEEDDSPDGIMARYSRDTLEEVFLDVARGRGAGSEREAAHDAPRETCHERSAAMASRCTASAR